MIPSWAKSNGPAERCSHILLKGYLLGFLLRYCFLGEKLKLISKDKLYDETFSLLPVLLRSHVEETVLETQTFSSKNVHDYK